MPFVIIHLRGEGWGAGGGRDRSDLERKKKKLIKIKLKFEEKKNASLVRLCVVVCFTFFSLPQMAFWTEPLRAPRWKVSASGDADGYLVGVEDCFFFPQPR